MIGRHVHLTQLAYATRFDGFIEIAFENGRSLSLSLLRLATKVAEINNS